MAVAVEDGARFQPIILEPGAPGAFVCFGSWESVKACEFLVAGEEPLVGCPQAEECRAYTLERNPPTTRFRAKPRRDGRFEVQQFREFIGEHETYCLDVQEGQVVVTCPGDRKVPKSKRFFLHTKHVMEAGMDLERDFELVVALDQMVVRQAGAVESATGERPRARREEEDPEARRRRIAERLRERASVEARKKDDDDEAEEDLDIEIDIEVEDGDDSSDDEDDVDLDLEDLDLDDLGKLSSSEVRKLSELRARNGDQEDDEDDEDDDASVDDKDADDDED